MTSPLPTNARVLLVRLSALGDVLFVLETLASLKAERPDVQIDFLVEDRFATLLRDHPQIDQLIVYPRKHKSRLLKHVLRLRKTRYDAVLDLHGNTKSGIQVWLTRAKQSLGYTAPSAREGAQRYYKHAIELPLPLPHRADRGYYLLRALGLKGEVTAPILPFPAEPVDFWPARIPEAPTPEAPAPDGHSPRLRIAIHPGTSAFAEFKRWPIRQHTELARELIRRGFVTAISFGPGEEDLTLPILREAKGTIPLDGKQIGLQGLADVYRQADLVIASDTGPLHIAAAAGARTIALFGPKDPGLYGPRGEGHQVLYHDVPCRPCTLRQCASPQCVLGLPLAKVLSAVDSWQA